MTLPERRRVYYQECLVGLHEKYGRQDVPWREAALGLLGDYADYLAYADYRDHARPADIPTIESLHAQRLALLETGVDEPYLLYICSLLDPARKGRFRDEEVDAEKAMRDHASELGLFAQYETVILALNHGILEVRLAAQNTTSLKAWAKRNRVKACNRYADLFDREVELSPETQVELAMIYRYYGDDIDVNQITDLMRATEQVTPDKQWLAHMLRGMVYIESAWEARSGEWARDVADDQWRRFEVYLQLAEDELTAALALRPDRSAAATEMITVSMGRDDGREMEWFEKAIAVDPLDTEAYRNVQWASRTRWGGDVEKMLAIARRAYDAGRYDTDLPERFERGISNIISDYDYDMLAPGAMGGQADEVWRMLRAYLDKRVAEPTPNRPPDWCWSRGFRLAYRTGRPDEQWDYFAKLDFDPDRLYQPYFIGIDKRWDIGEFALQREPEALVAFERAKGLLNAEMYDLSEQALQEAAAKAQSPWAKTHVQDLQRLIAWDRAFWDGQWVDLLEHGLEGWRPSRGIAVEAEKGVKVTPNVHDDELRLLCGLNMGDRYEAGLTLRVPEGFHSWRWGGAGFVLNPTIRRKWNSSIFVFASRRNKAAVWLQDPDFEPDDDVEWGQPFVGDTVNLTLQRWGNSIRCFVNGVVVVEQHELATEQYGHTELGLASWQDRSVGAYHFESLRVRRLEKSPFENAPILPQAF